MQCRVSGCAGRSSRWGAYCNTHKARDRRHGNPGQETITVAALKPYRQRVRERIAKNRDSDLWAALDARWEEAVENCKRYLAAIERGVPYQRHERTACDEMLKLTSHIGAREVIETGLAVYLMQEEEPRRFRSDRAFWFQLTRRLRGLSDVNVGAHYDHASGRTKRVYRDLSPRAAESFGRRVSEALGAAGVYIAQLETRQAEERRNASLRVADAMASLQ